RAWEILLSTPAYHDPTPVIAACGVCGDGTQKLVRHRTGILLAQAFGAPDRGVDEAGSIALWVGGSRRYPRSSAGPHELAQHSRLGRQRQSWSTLNIVDKPISCLLRLRRGHYCPILTKAHL